MVTVVIISGDSCYAIKSEYSNVDVVFDMIKSHIQRTGEKDFNQLYNYLANNIGVAEAVNCNVYQTQLDILLKLDTNVGKLYSSTDEFEFER